MHKHIRQLKKIFLRQHKDYTLSLYFLRVSSFILTWLYAGFVLFDTKKRIDFHATKNPLYTLYIQQIEKQHTLLNTKFNARFLKHDRYDFNGIYLPKVTDVTTLRCIYEDVLSIYTEKNDHYTVQNVITTEKNSTEGPFCYSGPHGEDITIHAGDIVIDAGAWIGDFSAYCAKKKAFVYAFEPTPSTRTLLEKTITYNNAQKYITIEPYGLGEKKGLVNFSDTEIGSANRFNTEGALTVPITTLDEWVKENSITRIDFIKADIEGAEREFLRGTTEVLKKLQPTLSLCTYHLADDPEVLEKIILDSNPKYKIIQRKMKLFAYVPKNQ